MVVVVFMGRGVVYLVVGGGSDLLLSFTMAALLAVSLAFAVPPTTASSLAGEGLMFFFSFFLSFLFGVMDGMVKVEWRCAL